MEKNKNSSPSMCTKFRQAIASNPAVRAIQHISSFNQEHKVTNGHSNSPSSPPHHKVHKEPSSLGGAIPINFNYTPPIENGNSKGATSTHVGNSERTTKVGVMQHDHEKESMDINDTFKEFIVRAKNKIRTISFIGRGQSNYPAAAPDHEEVHRGTATTEKNEDPFKDYILRAKKKIRTTTTVGQTGSLRRRE